MAAVFNGVFVKNEPRTVLIMTRNCMGKRVVFAKNTKSPQKHAMETAYKSDLIKRKPQQTHVYKREAETFHISH